MCSCFLEPAIFDKYRYSFYNIFSSFPSTKEVIDVTDVDPQVISEANGLAQERFALELEWNRRVQAFKDQQTALRAEHEDELAQLQIRIDEIDGRVWGLIEQHRTQLLTKGMRSFATLSALFKLRKTGGGTKVIDADKIMKVARRLRVLKQFANPPKQTWTLDSKRFLSWLENRPELRKLFADGIEVTAEGESLTLQPNETYVVVHDNQRISPPSISIKKPRGAGDKNDA